MKLIFPHYGQFKTQGNYNNPVVSSCGQLPGATLRSVDKARGQVVKNLLFSFSSACPSALSTRPSVARSAFPRQLSTGSILKQARGELVLGLWIEKMRFSYGY